MQRFRLIRLRTRHRERADVAVRGATTRLFEIDRLKDRLKPDPREHLAILDPLMAGDEAGARRAGALHMQSLIDFAIPTVR